MRYLLSNLPLPIGREAWSLSRVLSDTLGLPETDFSYIRLERRSLDARHKGSIRFLVALSFDSDSEVPQEFVPPGVQLTLATPSLPFLVNPLSQKGRVVIEGVDRPVPFALSAVSIMVYNPSSWSGVPV